MFPNLLGQKAFRKMSNEDMANVIGVNRTTYESKMRSGRFIASECDAYCKFFDKPFAYLFATEDSAEG